MAGIFRLELTDAGELFLRRVVNYCCLRKVSFLSTREKELESVVRALLAGGGFASGGGKGSCIFPCWRTEAFLFLSDLLALPSTLHAKLSVSSTVVSCPVELAVHTKKSERARREREISNVVAVVFPIDFRCGV